MKYDQVFAIVVVNPDWTGNQRSSSMKLFTNIIITLIMEESKECHLFLIVGPRWIGNLAETSHWSSLADNCGGVKS